MTTKIITIYCRTALVAFILALSPTASWKVRLLVTFCATTNYSWRLRVAMMDCFRKFARTFAFNNKGEELTVKLFDDLKSFRFFAALIYFSATNVVWAEGEQHYANLGDCQLKSGEVLKACRLGYRTLGTLNAERSNAVLFPTWLTGNSKDLIDYDIIGPGSLVDSNRYFVIAVDAFGNGVSSSPSNSYIYDQDDFPNVSIADMVSSQHRLLTEELGIKKLAAVVGISMGGMQALEWAVSYPLFTDKAITIVGSPKMTSYDLLLWHTELAVIEALVDRPGGDEAARRINGGIDLLTVQTPEQIVNDIPTDQFKAFLAEDELESMQIPSRDRALQLKAIIGHDITAEFDGSWERVNDRILARVFIVVATQDHLVNPTPALELASVLNSRTLELTGPCGHLTFICERENFQEAVAEFLAE